MDGQPKSETFEERIQTAYTTGGGEQFAKEDLAYIRHRLELSTSYASRALTNTVALALIFELLVRAGISKISIGPFEINDLSFIRLLIPPLVAFLYMNAMRAMTDGLMLRQASVKLVELSRKDLWENGLFDLAVPTYQIIIGRYVNQPDSCLFSTVAAIYAAYIVVLFPLFLIYSTIRQFQYFGFGNVLLWMSLALTIFPLIVTVGATRAYNSGGN